MAGDTPSPAPSNSTPRPRLSGPLPGFAGRLVEPVYRAVVTRRNKRFDSGRGAVRFDVPVLSIGNLSVGGTGKTPMVMHILSLILRAGGRPCIAMRGYTPRRGGSRRGAADGVPDETDSYRRLFPNTPIVAQPDRASGVRKLLDNAPPAERPTCIVLDDGFQHRRIARDLDIVLIDASRSPFTDRLLPAGWLREPVESLQRASLVVLTHAELVGPDDVARMNTQLIALRARPAEAVTRHAWTGLIDRDSAMLPLDWLLGKRLVACCAIGNPDGFLHSLKSNLDTDGRRPGVLAGSIVLPDHDPYAPGTIARLLALAQSTRADAIIVSDKDWSKLRHVPAERWGGRPLVRPALSLLFDRGGREFDSAVLRAAAGPA